MAKYGIQKPVGRWEHITGKSYDMYYTPDVIIDCQQFPKGKWILSKRTKKGLYKLGSHPTRKQCVTALKKEIGI